MTDPDKMTRRELLLGVTYLTSGFLLSGCEILNRPVSDKQKGIPFPGGEKVGELEFVGEGETVMESTLNSGLDGRLYSDLSKLTPDSLIMTVDKFYIRTRCPDLIDFSSKPWTISVDGLVTQPRKFSMNELAAKNRDMGVHLMECSGNPRNAHFGMISACRWSGVPIAEILSAVNLKQEATHVLVSGMDSHSQSSKNSCPGASWIFPLNDLISSQAFLATHMNGEVLTRDHGYPVRLFVPGWYGCTCIKWVNAISLVGNDENSTSQMREFAERTHQKGVPDKAQQFQPATIDRAAMPIRVEMWNVRGKIKYNVVGIVWGGNRVNEKLEIRFNPDQPYVAVENYSPVKTETWSLWSHSWMPSKTGNYRIRLRVPDADMVTKRLDIGRYVRSVDITEV